MRNSISSREKKSPLGTHVARLGAAATLLAACTTSSVSAETLYFVRGSNIHTEIVLPTQALRNIRPELVAHIESDLVMIGWGDRSFFGAPKRQIGTTLKAMFLPTSATLKVHPADSAALEISADTQAFVVDDDALKKVVGFIDKTVPENEVYKTVDDAKYFIAGGTYTMFNTCNNWTGRAMRHAGVPVASWRSWTAGNLERQVKYRLALAESEQAPQQTLAHARSTETTISP